MSLKVTVKVPVRLFTSEEWGKEKSLPNKLVTRTLTLPFDFVPTSLELTHYLASDNKSILRLYVEVVGTQWDEVSNTIFVQGKMLYWHDESFAHAIETMGQFGWEMVDY